MKTRPAYYKRLMPPHPFQWNGEDGARCCGRKGFDGRPCGLPEANRHHKMPARPPPDDRQLRLDIDG